MANNLKDLLDLPRLQALLDALDAVHSLPSAIIDARGEVLTATGWQEICTRFHRAHPEARRLCLESDTRLSRELVRSGSAVVYTCPHGLVDTATPIIVDGCHLGNVFTGQLFTQPPDEARFTEQARRYGFDEREYLAAMRKVPVISEDRLRKNLGFLLAFTEMLVEVGLKQKWQIETEAELRESELRYRRITEGLTDYQYTVRVENGHAVGTTQSPACAQITGYSAEEFAADPYLWIAMVAPEDRDAVIERVRSILAGAELPPIEHRIRRKDGALRWVSDTTIVFRDRTGAVRAYDGVIKDITDRRSAEEAIRASEERYRSLFERSRDVIFIATRQGRFLDINPAGVALFGYPSKEALTQVDIRDLYVHPEERLLLWDLLDCEGFVEDFQTVLVGRNGRQINVSLTATIIRDAAGHAGAVQGILRDVTEEKRLEDQLRQSQKMESIGTLAGGVAHDFNNILTAITGYGHLTLMRLAANDPSRAYLQQILESAERGAHLTQDLLLFSRKRPINRHPVDLNEGIRRLHKFLTRVIGEDITFEVRLFERGITVLADEHQISQVLMNLAANARDAMPGGGVFSVCTSEVELDERFVAFHAFGKPGRYALISVADTGTGMDDDTRQRVFEPFFTTKESGKGTGLGLAVVYGIVKQHEGLVTVESQPGCGTTFRVYLPVIEPGESGERKTPAQDLAPGGTETILMAEDDAAVRRMTEQLLSDYGYTVITAVDGEDAVRAFREHGESVRLLLFDVVMPRKNGRDAYEEIRSLRPDIRVIFQSGYERDLLLLPSAAGHQAPVVTKPIEIQVLLKTIRTVLDGGPAGEEPAACSGACSP